VTDSVKSGLFQTYRTTLISSKTAILQLNVNILAGHSSKGSVIPPPAKQIKHVHSRSPWKDEAMRGQLLSDGYEKLQLTCITHAVTVTGG
jgi:hypothetical protein